MRMHGPFIARLSYILHTRACNNTQSRAHTAHTGHAVDGAVCVCVRLPVTCTPPADRCNRLAHLCALHLRGRCAVRHITGAGVCCVRYITSALALYTWHGTNKQTTNKQTNIPSHSIPFLTPCPPSTPMCTAGHRHLWEQPGGAGVGAWRGPARKPKIRWMTYAVRCV
jgi:hypothetical protein